MSERTFPVFGGPSIPWELIAPHEKQAFCNHDQDLETLARRGGLSCCEAVAVLNDRRWFQMNEVDARKQLIEIRDKDWQQRAIAAEKKLEELEDENRHLKSGLKGPVYDNLQSAKERAEQSLDLAKREIERLKGELNAAVQSLIQISDLTNISKPSLRNQDSEKCLDTVFEKADKYCT